MATTYGNNARKQIPSITNPVEQVNVAEQGARVRIIYDIDLVFSKLCSSVWRSERSISNRFSSMIPLGLPCWFFLLP